MDKNTFGPYPAAKSLVRIMENSNDKGLKSSVGRRLSQHRSLISKIENRFSGRNLKYLLHLVTEDTKIKTNKSNWPKEVKTHFNNVVSSDYKIILENNDLK